MTEKDPSDQQRDKQDGLDLDQEAIRDLDVEDDGEDVRGGRQCPVGSCRPS